MAVKLTDRVNGGVILLNVSMKITLWEKILPWRGFLNKPATRTGVKPRFGAQQNGGGGITPGGWHRG